jgi:hypothetical protein
MLEPETLDKQLDRRFRETEAPALCEYSIIKQPHHASGLPQLRT